MTHTRFFIRLGSLLLSIFVPVLAFAQTPNQPQSIDKLGAFLQQFIRFIDLYLVPLVFAIAFIVFIFGIFQYFILGGADEEKRTKGRAFMVWGIIGFFVMVAVWGILNLLLNSFGFGGDSRPPLPTFEGAVSAPSNAGSALPAAGTTKNAGSNTNTGGGIFVPAGDKCASTACAVGYSCNPTSGACEVDSQGSIEGFKITTEGRC